MAVCPSHFLPVIQAVLRSREAIQRYYDCALIADDEMAAVPLESRNIVLRLGSAASSGEGGVGAGGVDSCPHPDPSKAGVTLTRAFTERKLYLQVWGMAVYLRGRAHPVLSLMTSLPPPHS